MKLTLADLIKEFKSKYKDKFKDVPESEIDTSIHNIFEFTRFHLRNYNELPQVKVKYLGKFYVTPKRIKELLFQNQFKYEKGFVKESTYLRRKAELEYRYDQLLNHGYQLSRELNLIDGDTTNTTNTQENEDEGEDDTLED